MKVDSEMENSEKHSIPASDKSMPIEDFSAGSSTSQSVENQDELTLVNNDDSFEENVCLQAHDGDSSLAGPNDAVAESQREFDCEPSTSNIVSEASDTILTATLPDISFDKLKENAGIVQPHVIYSERQDHNFCKVIKEGESTSQSVENQDKLTLVNDVDSFAENVCPKSHDGDSSLAGSKDVAAEYQSEFDCETSASNIVSEASDSISTATLPDMSFDNLKEKKRIGKPHVFYSGTHSRNYYKVIKKGLRSYLYVGKQIVKFEFSWFYCDDSDSEDSQSTESNCSSEKSSDGDHSNEFVEHVQENPLDTNITRVTGDMKTFADDGASHVSYSISPEESDEDDDIYATEYLNLSMTFPSKSCHSIACQTDDLLTEAPDVPINLSLPVACNTMDISGISEIESVENVITSDDLQSHEEMLRAENSQADIDSNEAKNE